MKCSVVLHSVYLQEDVLLNKEDVLNYFLLETRQH